MDATSSEPLTKTLDESGIFAPVRKHFEALDAFLEAQVQEFAPAARESLRYTFAHRGKRLRPALVFFSGWKGEDAVEPAAVRAAATVELIHLATLVHDDILDDAALRHALAGELTDAATLIIAQRVSTIHDADQIVVLKDGEVVGLGRHDDLMESCPTYRAIADSQTRGGSSHE